MNAPTVPTFWELNHDQYAMLGKVVRDKHVVDLGAGNCCLASLCLQLGAASALAVDKEFSTLWHRRGDVEAARAYFAEFLLLPHTVALLSWPVNYLSASETLLQATTRARTVVYIGMNDQWSRCGTPELFMGLRGRYPEFYGLLGWQEMHVYSHNPIPWLTSE